MTERDEQILRYLVEHDLILTPKGLAYNLDAVNYYQAAGRLKHLEEHGMVEYPEPIEGVKRGGIYRASDLGRRFVKGDITLAELRELVDE